MQSHNGSKAMMSFVGYSKGKALFNLRIFVFQLSSIFLDQEKTLRLADYSVGKR